MTSPDNEQANEKTMDKLDEKTTPQPREKSFLVKLTLEVADLLEDVQYGLARRRRRRVTKKQLVEQAIRDLAAKLAHEIGA